MGLHSLPVPGRIVVSPFGGGSRVHKHTYPWPSRHFLAQRAEDWIFLRISCTWMCLRHSQRAVLWSNLHCLIGSKLVQTCSPGAETLIWESPHLALHPCWYQEGAKWGPHLGSSPPVMAASGDKSSDGWGKAPYSTPNSDCSQPISNSRLPGYLRSSLLRCIWQSANLPPDTEIRCL